MKDNKTEFHEVNHEYRITSKELKKKLGLTGDVLSMGLYEGRSPQMIEDGVSADYDVWYINTQERAKKDDYKIHSLKSYITGVNNIPDSVKITIS